MLRKYGSDVVTTPTAASIVAGFCTARACARPSWVPTRPLDLFSGSSSPTNENAMFTTLSPGRYWIALVADGKPVTVTLRFPGTGRTTLTSGTRKPPVIDMPGASTDNGQTYSAGTTHRTRSASLFYYLSSWKYVYGPPKSANQQGVCAFDGAPVAGPTGAYQYPCGGSDLANFFVFGQRETGRKTGPGSLLDEYVVTTDAYGMDEVDGALSIGGFINGASPATSAHTTILWVDFP